MAGTFFAGKYGTVKIGIAPGTAMPLTDWSIDLKTESLDVTNFTSLGWQEVLGGVYSLDISASGPYNGASLITQGALVTFRFDVDDTAPAPHVPEGPYFTGQAIVTSIKIDQSVKDVAKISYTATSHGKWTPSDANTPNNGLVT